MNPRVYGDDLDFVRDEPMNPGIGMNVFERVRELYDQIEEINRSIERLEEYQDACDQDEVPSKVAYGALSGIKHLMRGIERIEYFFPELRMEPWFSEFKGDVHHTYWRVEDGRFDELVDGPAAERDCMEGEVATILDKVSGGSFSGPVSQLNQYIKHYADDLSPSDAPDKYYEEIFEARDLVCLGYYATGLMVLGRAVERALIDLGRARNIESVKAYNREYDWDEAKFGYRAEALYNADMPDQSGKLISKNEYHQIHILVDARNQVAHSEYREIAKENAVRMMMDAYDLLMSVEQRREEIESLDMEINSITSLSINP